MEIIIVVLFGIVYWLAVELEIDKGLF